MEAPQRCRVALLNKYLFTLPVKAHFSQPLFQNSPVRIGKSANYLPIIPFCGINRTEIPYRNRKMELLLHSSFSCVL